MSKMIIYNRDFSLTDIDALAYVEQVIALGRISDSGESYCFATRFKDNRVVVAKRNKHSDTFIVYDGGLRDENKAD